MTEYWVSTKKHYCETCNCWLSAHKLNIRNHERSARHLENFRKLMNKSSARRDEETKNKEFLEKELQKLERVEKQYLSSLNRDEISNKKEENISTYIKDLNTPFKNISFHNTSPQNCYAQYYNTQNKLLQNETKENILKWIIMIDEDTGRLVYLNIINNKIEHEPPKDLEGNLPLQESFTEQNGWYKYFDIYSNNFYYYNINNSYFIWQYSSNTINNFINYLKSFEGKNLLYNYEHAFYDNSDKNDYYKNYMQSAHSTASYIPTGNQPNSTIKLNPDYSQGKEQTEEEKSNENIQSGKVNFSFSWETQDKSVDTKEKGVNGKVKGNSNLLRIFENENEKNENEKNEKDISSYENNNSNNYQAKNNSNYYNHAKEKKNDQEKSTKKRISRWDQKYPLTNKENEKKAKTEKGDDKEKKEEKKADEDSKKEKEKDETSQGEMKTLLDEDKDEQKEPNNTKGTPGEWVVIENTNAKTIPNSLVEDLFYKIKTREEIEQEELSKIEQNIKDEYTMYDEFYIKKKELEHPELYLNQEFQFIDKPVYKKTTDKKNDTGKVNFAKRNLKSKNKKSDIINAIE